jgi:ADP-ribose pyrophosphatase YjhB (NUDIX family)
MSAVLNLLHRLKTRLLKLLGVNTRGVRVMVFNPHGEILLIRHSYGRSDLYRLPGGGIRPWEKPEQAARRETREEVGCTLTDLIAVSTHVSEAEGRRDTVHFFSAVTLDQPVADNMEVDEAAFFPLHELPDPLSPAAVRRLQEHLGERQADGRW